MSSSFRVVCVGVVTVDALALVERYPAADERVVGEEVIVSGGGPAANAAVVLARQGVPVSFIGRVGADATGEQAIRLLENEGVDVSGVLRDKDVPTQASCVVVSKTTQARAISTLAVPPLPAFEAFGSRAMELVRNAEWVHTDHLGFSPVAAFLKRSERPARPRLAVDAGNPVPGLDLSLLDLYVPTTESMVREFGLEHTLAGIAAAADKALAAGASAVVATNGRHGSTAWWSDRFALGQAPGRVDVPAMDGVTIRSTLGAGDVFHGALISALCRGCDWAAALAQANATAALSCRGLDGRSAVPTLDELRRYL
ncbi:carbohydrate kinase family protein [Propionivibrio dicarboxylicus]|uniref:Sulfofructose kinase n=1 Tax=Propionivibrio dicarboxylicus TaxID=83767 RepID=A0A1G8ETG0_9RHOO|nr:carbohydrate kinase family protein [Propionivibrio dicarboxylicus]SDH73188.1 sulfofructose kinase [Propionivibrio dicarboxylicus]